MNEERSAGKPSLEEMLYRVDCQIQMAESVIDEKVDKDLMLIMVRSLKIWKAIRALIEQSGKSGKPNTVPDDIVCPECGFIEVDEHVICRSCKYEFYPPKPDTTPEDMPFRRLLWTLHNPEHRDILYGDDGEMQCSACMIDFKRNSPRAIEKRLYTLDQERRQMSGKPDTEGE